MTASLLLPPGWPEVLVVPSAGNLPAFSLQCHPLNWERFRRDFRDLYRNSQAGTGSFVLPAHERKKHPAPGQLFIGCYDGDVPVAFHFGTTEPGGTFRMRNSVVAPAYRGRGVYAVLLQQILTWAGQQPYHTIESSHRADNNAILIPKLRAGFHISGLEIDPRNGTLVRLTYYSSAIRKELYLLRTGAKPISDQMTAHYVAPDAGPGEEDTAAPPSA